MPTGDPHTTRSILDLLRELNQRIGLTIMLITHDMGVVKHICDRVAILEKEQVVEKGKVVDLAVQPTSRLAQDFFPRRHKYQAHPGAVLATIAFQGKVASQPILTVSTGTCRQGGRTCLGISA